MKKTVKIWIWLLGLIVCIIAASVLYKNLQDDYKSNDILQEKKETAEETKENDSEDVNSSDETEPGTNDPEEEEATPAPDFTVYTDEDEEITLSSQTGKPIILNFWASWCPPCKSEMPHFQEAYEESGEDFIFMMINLTDGSRETKETAAKFLEEMGYTFPVYFDLDQSAMTAYGTVSIPATYFIDEEGNIAASAVGAIDKDTLLQGMEMIRADD